MNSPSTDNSPSQKLLNSFQTPTEGIEIDISRLPGADRLRSANPDELIQIENGLADALLGPNRSYELIYTGMSGRMRVTQHDRAVAFREERQTEYAKLGTILREIPNRPPINPALQDVAIVHGIGTPEFSAMIAHRLGVPLVTIDYTTFANSEILASTTANVRNKDLFLVCRISPPVNEAIMAITLTLDALKQGAGARSITLVTPYYAYGRQDQRKEGRQCSLSNAVIAKLWEPLIDGLITVDIHSKGTKNLFPQGFHNITPYEACITQLKERVHGEKIVAVSPDQGGMNRSDAAGLPGMLLNAFGDNITFVECDKTRGGPNQVKEMILPKGAAADIVGRTALLFDDMLDTGGTVMEAAGLLRRAGATKVIVLVTHPIGSRGAFERFERLTYEHNGVSGKLIDEILTTDSLPLVDPKGSFIRTTDITELVAKRILDAHLENIQIRDGLSDSEIPQGAHANNL